LLTISDDDKLSSLRRKELKAAELAAGSLESILYMAAGIFARTPDLAPPTEASQTDL
jgi:hypothetical protein